MSATRCQRIKSNTDGILTAMDTFNIPEREDGICAYCDLYQTELALDGCCPTDKYALPSDLTCRKARVLRARANAEAFNRGEIEDHTKVDPLEGFAWEENGTTVWHRPV